MANGTIMILLTLQRKIIRVYTHNGPNNGVNYIDDLYPLEYNSIDDLYQAMSNSNIIAEMVQGRQISATQVGTKFIS